MASSWKDSSGQEEDEIMVRLSNHINSISLILDVVDIRTLHTGSRLEQAIAQQLIEMRIWMDLVSDNDGGSLSSSCYDSPQSQESPATPANGNKNAQKKHVPQNRIMLEQEKLLKPLEQQDGTKIACALLAERKETGNFERKGTEFYCLLCGTKARQWQVLLDHVNGAQHAKKLKMQKAKELQIRQKKQTEQLLKQQQKEQLLKEQKKEQLLKQQQKEKLLNKQKKEQLLKQQQNHQLLKPKEGMKIASALLAERNEMGNFEMDGTDFYCLLCENSTHWKNLSGHVNGAQHAKKLKVQRANVAEVDLTKQNLEQSPVKQLDTQIEDGVTIGREFLAERDETWETSSHWKTLPPVFWVPGCGI